MQAYSIRYSIDNKDYNTVVEAKDVKTAKTKIGKKHGFTTGRKVKVLDVKVVGYF